MEQSIASLGETRVPVDLYRGQVIGEIVVHVSEEHNMSREMPNAVSLEQSVLGSLMVYPKVIQDCQELDLHAEEFYLPSHQQIYQAICTIHENGQPIDMNTVVNRLQETDQLESSQGADYIIRLADSAISSATSRSYIETIKNKAQLRRLIYVADKISEEGYSSGEDIDTEF